jgi:curved DNA-binding protein CbpA
MAKDHYATLSVARNASPEQIRVRFRELARSRHPDRFRGAEKAEAERDFQAITEAFNVLSDPERRRLHDRELARADEPPRAGDRAQLLRAYMERGVKAYRDRSYVEAAENFDRATQTEPDNASAWHHLAIACSQQPRWRSRAMSAAARACELEPMNPAYLKLAGRLFAAAGMTARAEQYYNEALTWGGEDATVRASLTGLKSARKGKTGLYGKAG